MGFASCHRAPASPTMVVESDSFVFSGGSMPTVAVKAHFDGQHIQLDQPFELPINIPLTVIIPDLSALHVDHEEWLAFSAEGLAAAYGDNEPEYTIEDARP